MHSASRSVQSWHFGRAPLHLVFRSRHIWHCVLRDEMECSNGEKSRVEYILTAIVALLLGYSVASELDRFFCVI